MTPFELWPAIDLKGGKAVRLLHGEMDRATTYADIPAAQAWAFRDAGFDRLHVVDLDGAFAGESANGEAVRAILYETDAKVQLGGGIRTREAVDAWLDLGITRVILGTAALKDPALVHGASKAHPGRVVVGIDARDGLVATEGWSERSEVAARDLALRFEDAGVAAIVFTDIGRDGALTGVNVEATAALARELTIPVLASGGVRDADDIAMLAAHRAHGVAGTIIGRALYEGTLDPVAAQAAARAS